MSGWQSRLGLPGTKRQILRTWAQKFLAVLGEYGHAMGGPTLNPDQYEPGKMMIDNSWRLEPKVEEELSSVGARFWGHPHIFPNLWFMPNNMQASLRLPKGPTHCEIWWFTYYYAQMPKTEQYETVRRGIRHNGPAGMFELEDGENWGESTTGNKSFATRNAPLNYSLNVGRGEVIDDETGPPHVDALVNEHGQLWHYRNWAHWMAAESWRDLRENHPAIPDSV
jgi:hypothetical protein